MTVVDRDIDVICVCYEKQPPIPIRFRLQRHDGSSATVQVDQVRTIEEQHPAGMHSYLYTCMSDQGEYVVTYILKYIVKEIRWILFQIL